jgi:aminoglycoside 6'-N-acetyltransferase
MALAVVSVSKRILDPWLATLMFAWVGPRQASPHLSLQVMLTVGGHGSMNGVAHADDVNLRVLDLQADLPLLERWLRSPHVVRWWGTTDLHATVLAQRSSDAHAVITADGRPVGYLCWQKPSPSELEAAGLSDLSEDLVDIDILIGEPEFLGRGIGPRALVLLLARLNGEGVGFAGLGTSTSNRVAIRAFEKAGFHLFRDFEDPEHGPCKYMVAQLPGTIEQTVPADGATRRR